MAATTGNLAITPEEKKFRELVATGDDFMKIEIFRSAAAFYRRAIDIRPEDDVVKKKLDDTRLKIKAENRAIYIITAVAAVAVILFILLG